MRTAVAAIIGAVFIASAAGCGDRATPTGSTSAAAPLAATAAWVKATAGMPSAAVGSGATAMTGAFLTLTNGGNGAVSLQSVSTPAASRIEIHETVDGAMRPKAGGLSIPARGSVTLQPGGDHIMLIGLVKPLAPGDEVTLTLTFAGAPPVTVTAPVKPFVGADEPYHSHAATPIG